MDHLPVSEDKKKLNPPHRFFGRYDVRFYGRLPELETGFIEHAVSQRIIHEHGGQYELFLDDYLVDGDIDAYMTKVQAWAWFQLVSEVFGTVDFEELLTVTRLSDETEVRILDSTKLITLMSDWRSSVRRMNKDKQKAVFEKVKLATVTVWKICNQIDNHDMAEHIGDMLMLFSVRVLVSSIWDMLYYSNFGFANLNRTYRFSAELIKYPRMPQSYRPLALLMDSFGWCHHEYLRVMSTYHLTTVWTIALTHGRDRPGGYHQDCHTAAKCIAGDVDPDTHRAVHLTEDCSCEEVGPDMMKVKGLLSKHKIPIVRCSLSKGGDPIFEVLAATKSARHIAISHTWADGVVIPRGNRVYRCQFLKILSYLHMARAEVWAEKIVPNVVSSSASSLVSRVMRPASTSPVDIWYDIFCIPNDDTPEVKLLRRWAISRITPVYAGAEAVMVFDKGLTEAGKKNMPMVEELVRIASCRWTTRCWTFSEASLASRSDMIFCIGDVARRRNEVIFATPNNPEFKDMDVQSTSICRNLTGTAFHPYSVFWLWKEAKLNEYIKFGMLWNSLTSRSTSRPQDVWELMATLLGLDSAEIAQLTVEERLPALLKDVHRIPASFIFRNIPRSTKVPPHMRWMPTAVKGQIRDSDGTFFFTEEPQGICFDGASKWNFVFTVDQRPLNQRFVLMFNDERLHKPLLCEITLHNETAQQLVEPNTQLCLSLFIAHRRPEEDGAGSTGEETEGESGIGCCIIVTDRKSFAWIRGDFLSSVEYKIVGNRKSDYEATYASLQTVISCDRSQWYDPKKKKIEPHTIWDDGVRSEKEKDGDRWLSSLSSSLSSIFSSSSSRA